MQSQMMTWVSLAILFGAAALCSGVPLEYGESPPPSLIHMHRHTLFFHTEDALYANDDDHALNSLESFIKDSENEGMCHVCVR